MINLSGDKSELRIYSSICVSILPLHHTKRFSCSVDQLVHVMVEVQSDENQSDRNRMLLLAARAARPGRLSYSYPFIVVVLYYTSRTLVR
jgi:hypothetical protein